jgi:DNA ligase D-like protein (predicted ligase)
VPARRKPLEPKTTGAVTPSGGKQLPRFIPPMLAKPGEPFDSEKHLFEIKWDGTRTLAFIEEGSYRLINRRRIDMTDRYPEMGFLRKVVRGTVLDGEAIVFKDGKPDFTLLMSREQTRSPLKIRNLARLLPATYVVFDLLFESFQPLMALPLQERRQRLEQLVNKLHDPSLVLSEGVIGQGKALFQETCQRGLEGVVAKRLESRYFPGKRTDAWIKIKRGAETICAIIGFLPSGASDFRSLILAAEVEGEIRCVGKVGTGFTARLRERLNHMLWSRLRPRPVVSCKLRGKWVDAGLFCKVSYMEKTAGGEFRAPVFQELYGE